MASFTSPFEDDYRSQDSNEQRAREAAAPGSSPNNNAALPPPDRSDDMNNDDGAPLLPLALGAYLDSVSVQRLLKALLDYAVALHLMPAAEFERDSAAWLDGVLPAPLVSNIQAVIAHTAPKIAIAPAIRREYLARLANRLPISVAAQYGFVSIYHLEEDGFYSGHVVRLTGSQGRVFRLALPVVILTVLLTRLCEAIAAALFERDTTAASESLRALAEGRFPADVNDLALFSMFAPAATCEQGQASRCQLLCCDTRFERLQRILEKLPS